MGIKKVFSKIAICGVTLLTALGMATSSKAATETSLYLGLEEYRSSNLAYMTEERIMWKITSYDTDGNNPDKNRTIYCIKAGPGFGSSTNMGDSSITKRTYTVSFNLKDYNAIAAVDGGIYADVLPSNVTDTNNTDTVNYYNSLVWVLEHCYVPAKTSAETEMAATYRAELLTAAGIAGSSITDDEIDIAQQLAIWYFTNDDSYKITNESFSLWVKGISDSAYRSLGDKFDDGDYRNDDAVSLFLYLVNGGKANGNTVPNASGANTINIVDSSATVTQEGSNYIVGPYKLETNSTDYTLEATFKSLGNSDISYTLLDSNKQTTTSTLKELELAGSEFYLSTPITNNIDGAKFNVSLKEYQTSLTYWSVAGANTVDQPVVEIERTENTVTDEVEIDVPVYEFDLALRKYILKINNQDVQVSRVPVVSTSTIQDLANDIVDTVTKEHTKTPLLVKTGDIVLYEIRIYNEGEIDGYATEITDYLPDGLKLKEDSAINTENGWTNPSNDGKTIVTTKLADQSIAKFDGTTLSSLAVQIECEVIATNTSENNLSLKNIAEITQDKDINGNDVTDRDSVPGNLENDQKENYNPGESEQGWGYEDDDDYEELVLPGGIFDLALRKYILKINNQDVEVSRVPVVSASTIQDLANSRTQTVTKEHTKTPLLVETGDTVLYEIRIYNEGEMDGYATEITDYLPDGLKLKEDSAINTENGWTNPSNDGKTIITTKLADQIIAKFDGTTLSSLAVQIECEVIATNTSENNLSLKNIAEITEDKDENGNDITDRDSTPENLENDQKNNYNPGSSEQGWGYEDDDDYEELVLPGRIFDLALRKYILKINNQDVEVSRVPVVSASTIQDLANDVVNTVTKEHTKTPLLVETGDTVLYEIRIYNEGNIDGYATEITDYLPDGLKLKEDSAINTENGWTNPSNDGKTIITTKLADQIIAKFDGTTLSSLAVQIECEVIATNTSENNLSLKNIAEITEDKDENGNDITDRDSVPENLENDQKENYNPGESEQGWGYEDDDDYEELVLPAKIFDLALRKYITSVNGKELTDGTTNKYLREPTIDVTDLANDINVTTADYKHQKDPVGVGIGDIVIYTLRIYNEGQIDGYASSVTDYLPPQLEFVTDDAENFNAGYGWVIDQSLRKATTQILARDPIDLEENLIKAFDADTMETPDYVELKIKCRVKSTATLGEVITNIAEITDFTDADGNVITDVDSSKDNITLPTDANLPDYKGNTSNKSILNDKNYHYKGQEDDDDFEKLIIEEFDLALRKFITAVNDTEITNRVPVFTKTTDENGNYIYEHTKEPVEVETTDIVEYTIRIYNEGNIAGYAKEVKDDIPEGLEFLPNDEQNIEYRWVMLDADGNVTTDVNQAKSITTDYLSKEQEENSGDNLINEFDQDLMNSPAYKDVKVRFKVVAPSTYEGIITNIAEISNDSDEDGDEIDDKDSTPDNNEEDEDDIDEEHIKLSYFDLALRKFITAVDDTEVTNRYPVFTIDENGNYVYEHTKEPVEVENGNIVTYTIRIYNEGTKDGYAKEVKDDLPEGLEFLPENDTNTTYRWVMLDEEGNETDNIEEAVSIKTDYLSKEQEDATGRDNLLTAFDPDTMEEPDYRDIKIAFKVTEPNTSDRILINKAQISDDSDENGDDVIDIDSTPDRWVDGEDDQDIEKVKVKYFDLALRKWVTQAIVIEDGKETVTETGHQAEDDPEEVVKVEIVESKLNTVVVKFRYKIRVTNEGEIAGYVDEISDYIPEGLRFDPADNPLWQEVDGKVVTDQLKDTLLQPGESAEVEIILTWINGKDNLGLKVNVAEISKDRNDSDTPDIDSTPDNKKEGEDDIDDAPVILIIKTGAGMTREYMLLGAGIVAILGSGVVFIKKYVL